MSIPGEKISPYVFGIDLGTTNSCISVYKGRVKEVIPLEGENVLPSAISVRDNGEILVGRMAKQRALIAPSETVTSVKRHLGTDFKQKFKGLPDKEYSATDLSADILNKIREAAQESGFMNFKGSIRKVVICIPANFDDVKKKATKEAGELANLDVLYLLEEPVAAAIAYASEREREQTILVYDLGGGTFDVSILQVDSTGKKGTDFKVVAKEGIPKLGGDDFDFTIMEYAASEFEKESGINIMDLKKDQGIKAKDLRIAQQKLKDASEKAKIELTSADSTEIMIPNLIKDESGNLHNINVEITREKFEDMIRDLILQSKTAIEKALKNGKLTIEDISRIILVGGSTRTPFVKEMLTEMFDREPWGDLDPSTVVAQGAAFFGASMDLPDDTRDVEDKTEGEISIQNIVTHNLGIETAGGKFNILLEKGLDIPEDKPVEAIKEYTTPRDNMTEMRISTYQSPDSSEYVSDKVCVFLGEFYLTRIPPKPRGQVRIEVKFELDQQNLFKVTASSKDKDGSVKPVSVEINR